MPPELETVRTVDGWDVFVKKAFDMLHETGFRDKKAILERLADVEWVHGFEELLIAFKTLPDSKVIIVSDSHTLKIEQVSSFIYK